MKSINSPATCVKTDAAQVAKYKEVNNMRDDEYLGNRKNAEDNEYYENLWLLEQAAQWASTELELSSSSFVDRSVEVAPCTGTWIETNTVRKV